MSEKRKADGVTDRQMEQLTEEEKKILEQAARIRDRMKAEALEAGEITLEDAKGSASRKEQKAVNKAVKKAYREDLREEKEAEQRKKEKQKERQKERERENRNSARNESRKEGRNEKPDQKAPLPPAGKKKKKKNLGLKIFFAVVLVLAVFLTGVIIYLTVLAGEMNYRPYETSYVRPDYVLSDDKVTNILLIGTDGRESDMDTRSDSMIILSINPKKRSLVFTSFLRDSYVFINGVGQDRLNEAYFHGGPALLIETIEQNYQIGIDYYIHMNFYTFVDLIDAFGGVTIEVLQPELEYINGYIAEYDRYIGAPERDGFLPEPDGYGVRNLTGRQALAYSRVRYIGTDFGRTDRQRTVLKALVEKAKHSSPLKTLKALGTVLPQLETNIPQKKMVKLMTGAAGYMFYDVKQGRCPADGTWSNALMNGNQDVLAVDFAANREYLKNLIYD